MKSGKVLIAPLLIATLLTAGCSLMQREPPEPEHPPPPAAVHTGEVIAHIAQSMVGVPYRYGGSTPAGFDCSGLVYYAYVKAGVPVPRTAADLRKQSTPIPNQQLRPGDLVFFDTSWRSEHVGIYVGGGDFVHAPSSGKRVSRASIREGYYAKRLKQAGRLIDP